MDRPSLYFSGYLLEIQFLLESQRIRLRPGMRVADLVEILVGYSMTLLRLHGSRLLKS